MATPTLHSGVRDRRENAGLTQQRLATLVGISRQALIAIERGAAVPSTAVALQLGRALGCAVEDLFQLADRPATVRARAVGDPAGDPAPAWTAGARVALAAVDGQWIARAIDGEGPRALSSPADGIVAGAATARSKTARHLDAGGARVSVQTLAPAEALAGNLFVTGCDPGLGLLAAHVERQPGAGRVHWTELGSGEALAALAAGQTSVAGVHLYDEASGEFNVAPVRRRLPRRGHRLVNLASWEHGLVVSAGNPLRIRGVADLCRRRVRLVTREPGTGSRELLRRLLAGLGRSERALRVVAVARGHLAVAQTIAAGAADAGIATAAAARAFGLGFVPLGEARFDLVVPAAASEDARVQRLLEVMCGGRFRRELGGLPGYDSRRCGEIIAEVRG
jgi:molybdate-binding protein/DNA-binding XRE family transcriptional regulator